MKFFVIPYLLAVDLVVPRGRFDYKPTFFFHVMVNSSAHSAATRPVRTDYVIGTTMVCTPDPISLWCCFQDTKIRHSQSFANTRNDYDQQHVTTITREKFLLEFDETGVKISICNEKSQRSRRMVQKIVDLLNVDVDFEGDGRGGSSRLETVTIVDNCPIETRANLRRPLLADNASPEPYPRKLEDGFFKLMSHPNDFDETSIWSLDVNRTKNIAGCRNTQDFFFGSRGHEDLLHGYQLVSNVTSSVIRIRITNGNFTSTGYTEGTVTSGTMKFNVKDEITVSIGLDDIYVQAHGDLTKKP